MIEPEVAFAQLTDVMALAERCIKSSTQHVLDHCAAGRLALLFFVFDFFPIS